MPPDEVASRLGLDVYELDAPAHVEAVPFEDRRPMTPEEIYAERERRRAERDGRMSA